MNDLCDFAVLDCHHHIGELHDALGGLDGAASANSLIDADAEERASRLAAMDRAGIGQAVIVAGHAYLRPDGVVDTRRMNDRVAAYRAAPDRFVAAFGVAEPLHGQIGLTEIDRCATELDLDGISFHPRFHGASLDGPWVFRFVERLAEHGMIPYLHAIADTPENALWKVDQLAAAFPTLPMVVLDPFTDFEQAREVIPLAERRPNLLFDTSLALTLGMILPLIDEHGWERVVYGTDLYSWAAAPRGCIMQEILASALPVEAKRAILGDNLRRVLAARR